MNRRQALTALSVLPTSLLGFYARLAHANDELAQNTGRETKYKALVCIFLHGGNDSFNMLMPAEQSEYRDYQVSRSHLAIPFSGGVGLPSKGSDRAFAVHPSCSELAELYGRDRLAFIANVGNLVEPTTIESFLNGRVDVPPSLFSHNDQRGLWQTGVANFKGGKGWLGRAADQLRHTNSKTFSMNISLAGNNIMQTGEWTMPYSISPDGPPSTLQSPLDAILKNTAAPERNELLKHAYQETLGNAYQRNQLFSLGFNSHKINDQFPSSSLGQSLKAVATTIAARRDFGQSRQTFFVVHRGWDTHSDQIDKHSALLRDLSQSLSAFDKTMENSDTGSQVTTFTVSDFGRTLSTNGRGTDHGWGGNCIVAGGAVNGGSIYGNYPETLALGRGMDIGRNGRLLPGMSTEQYFAPLLHWFGLTEDQIADVLPNLYRFASSSDYSATESFMKA